MRTMLVILLLEMQQVPPLTRDDHPAFFGREQFGFERVVGEDEEEGDAEDGGDDALNEEDLLKEMRRLVYPFIW